MAGRGTDDRSRLVDAVVAQLEELEAYCAKIEARRGQTDTVFHYRRDQLREQLRALQGPAPTINEQPVTGKEE